MKGRAVSKLWCFWHGQKFLDFRQKIRNGILEGCQRSLMRHEFESSHESDFLTRLEKDARAHTSDHGHPILISSRILTHRGRATLISTTMAKGRAASRKSRVYIFREWLMKTYGSYLSQEIATVVSMTRTSRHKRLQRQLKKKTMHWVTSRNSQSPDTRKEG